MPPGCWAEWRARHSDNMTRVSRRILTRGALINRGEIKMRIIVTVGLTIALGLGTVLAPAAASAANASTASVSASHRSRAYAWELRRDGVHVRHVSTPRTFWIMRGGPDVKVKHMRWSSWGSHRARGAGTLMATDFHGWHNLGRVTIVFSDVVSGVMGYPHRMYEHLHLIGGGRHIGHHWLWQFATAVLPAGWCVRGTC
jgi:hypothetical protein